MKTLKQLINRYLYTMFFVLVFLSLLVVSVIQLKIEHDRAYTEGLNSLTQIEQIMSDNQQNFNSLKDEYRLDTEKNDLSYIFSLFRINPNISYFAIDSNTGNIIGASLKETVNLNCSEIGFSFSDIQNGEEEIYANICNKESYCILKKIDSIYVAYVAPIQYLYREIPIIIIVLFVCMVLIAIVLTTSFNEYLQTNLVNKLHKINGLLSSITNGNLKQVVDVRNVYELSELSTHINTMVQSLFSSNSKLTYILSRTNFYLGTYEYSHIDNHVQFSEYIPKLLSWDDDTLKSLSTSPNRFKEYIDTIRANPVPYEHNVYEIGDKYIKIDEIAENDYILGVVMDVTATVKTQKKLVQEIHLDTLTGLYNHKGIEIKLNTLFSSPEDMKSYALVSLKADGLAKINASYGPDFGDAYLKKIANILKDFGIKKSIAARQWGGAFILFLYGYDNEKDVAKAVDLLSYIQSHTILHLKNNVDTPIDFSFNYRIANGSKYTDYSTLMKELSDAKNTFSNH